MLLFLSGIAATMFRTIAQETHALLAIITLNHSFDSLSAQRILPASIQQRAY